MAEMDTAEGAARFLDGIEARLRAAYPRAVLGGRHDQIAQLATGLADMIRQLPDEEIREAEYEARLLAMDALGVMPKDAHGEYLHLNHDARERLRAALARKGAAA